MNHVEKNLASLKDKPSPGKPKNEAILYARITSKNASFLKAEKERLNLTMSGLINYYIDTLRQGST